MFAPDTYRARRQSLARTVGAGLCLIPGNDAAPMAYPANAHRFHQDATFRYYAGIDQPGLALTVDADTGTATLYGDDATMEDVVWTGPQTPLAELAARAGIDRVRPAAALADDLRAATQTVHTLPPYRTEHVRALADGLGWGFAEAKANASEAFIRAVVAQREIKTDEEVAEMERAVAVSAATYRRAMGMTRAGLVERELVGAVEGLAFAQGMRPSFEPIVSVRGEVLHNPHYGGTLADGQLLLMDSGVTTDTGYASDLTRTWPVSGRFTPEQRAVYEAVLAAHDAVIDGIRPGVPYRDLHLLAARVLVGGLQALGLMRGDPDEAVAAGAHALFFPHGLGHQIGLDVHDLEGLGEDFVGYGEGFTRSDQFGLAYLRMAKPLRAGHVVTVEPGLYFIDPLIDGWKAEGRHADFIAYDAVERFRGFGGVRIEDDVLVTETGARVLGPPVPTTVADVEAVVGA